MASLWRSRNPSRVMTLVRYLRGPPVTSSSQEILGERHKICPRPLSYRWYHSSPLSPNRKQFATLEGANEFLSSLSPNQQANLNSALQNMRENGISFVEPPSWKQLRLCESLHSALHHHYIIALSSSL